MQTESPLSSLCETLKQTKASADNYHPVLIKNEAVTRAVLIDPVLRALGWDTAKTHMIQVEKTLLGTSRVDYALYNGNGDVKVVIEAKSLDGDLSTASRQLVGYAHDFGKSGIILTGIWLTDGLKWLFYDDFNASNFLPTRTLDISN